MAPSSETGDAEAEVPMRFDDVTEAQPLVILGATGQLGSDIVRAAEAAGLPFEALGHDRIEVTDPASVEEALGEIEPSVVINSAAFHAVDPCEEQPAKAFEVNAAGALHVARAAHQLGARTLYISTDYVFDGQKPAPEDGATTPDVAYTHGDPAAPLNVYGSSKLAGEQLTLQADPNALVCRVSSLFGVTGARGKGGGNFIETMLGLAEKYPELKGVADQWMTPTYTLEAGRALVQLAQVPGVTGRIHVTSPEACTWYDLAEHALRVAGYDNPIERVGSDAFPSKAEKPRNSALNTDRLEKVLGEPLMGWREMVEAYIEDREST